MGKSVEVTLEGFKEDVDLKLRPLRQQLRNLGYAFTSPVMNKITIQTPTPNRETLIQLLQTDVIPSITNGRVPKPTLINLKFLEELYEHDGFLNKDFDEADVMLAIYGKLWGVNKIAPIRDERRGFLGRNPQKDLKEMLASYEDDFTYARKKLQSSFPVLRFGIGMFSNLPETLWNKPVEMRNKELYDRIVKTPALLFSETPFEVSENNPKRVQFRTFTFTQSFLDKYDFSPLMDVQEWAPPLYVRALDSVRSLIEVPGINTQEQLEEFATMISGKQQRLRTKEDAEVLLGTLIENASIMSIKHFTALLDLLSTSEMKVPYELLESTVTKFNLPEEYLTKFKKYQSLYHPSALPSQLEGINVHTNLDRYLDSNLDSLGLGKEVKSIATALREHNIVCLIDHTNYDGKRFKQGEYQSPSMRVENELVQGIIERRIEGLEDYSVIGFSKFDLFMKALMNYKVSKIPQEFQSYFVENASHHFKDLYSVLDSAREYATKVIFTIDGKQVDDPSAFGLVIDAVKRWNITTLISSRNALPGIPSVHIQPFTSTDLEERILQEKERIAQHYQMSVSDDFLKNMASRVSLYTDQTQDPLFTALKATQKACGAAQARDLPGPRNHELIGALANVFKQTDPGHTEALESTIAQYPSILKARIRGQDEAIEQIADLISLHMRGGRVGNSPLGVFMPGATGVGKTLLAGLTGKHFSLPWIHLDFSQYNEEHSTARLVGSPPGYVGDEEGELSKFFRDNDIGIAFIDEYEKAAAAVKLLVMNAVDKGIITAGSGAVYHRPNMIIIGASNAGARLLCRGTSEKEVMNIVARALADRAGEVKEEIVARWNIVPLYPISEDAFKSAIRDTLFELNDLAQFVNDGCRVQDVTDSAVQEIFRRSRDICRFGYTPTSSIGFQTEQELVGDTYYNLRQVPRKVNAALMKQIHGLHTQAKTRDKNSIASYVLDYNKEFVFEPL